MPLLTPPPSVLDIARRLEGAGFEAWCVGGAVRDAMLGHPHLDWDLATSATPDEVKGVFGHRRTIPIGIAFGTVGVLDQAGVLHEVTTFRRDIKTDGRHAVVEFGASLEDDLARRDFTINAMAYSPRLDELRDPFGGKADLERRLVRAVGDPDARMREDRLRALRAIRFASRFGFTIEEATLVAIERSAPHLGRLSAERVKQELEKTMEQVLAPSRALAQWKSTGALATLVPELAQLDPDVFRSVDCLALPGIPGRPQRLVNRLAALLIDLTPSARTTTLDRLRFSKQESSWINGLADAWQSVGASMTAAVEGDVPPTDREIRQWVAVIQRLRLGAFMRLALARWSAHGLLPSSAQQRAASDIYRRMRRSALRDPLTIADLAVDGDDLRRVGIPPGRVLGRILHHLLDCVLEDPALNTTDWLLQEAGRSYARDNGDGAKGSAKES